MSEPVYTTSTDETPETAEENSPEVAEDNSPEVAEDNSPEVAEETPAEDSTDFEALYRADEARIAELTAQLAQAQAAAQNNETAPDAVVDTAAGSPAVSGDDGAAQFVPVPPAPGTVTVDPASGEQLTAAQPVFPTDVPADDPAVEFDPAPELSDSEHPTVTAADEISDDVSLHEKVSEILVLVREIHETVAYVKAEAPKIGAALSNSPFGKMLPGILGSL